LAFAPIEQPLLFSFHALYGYFNFWKISFIVIATKALERTEILAVETLKSQPNPLYL
jgi:hypothetical protein